MGIGNAYVIAIGSHALRRGQQAKININIQLNANNNAKDGTLASVTNADNVRVPTLRKKQKAAIPYENESRRPNALILKGCRSRPKCSRIIVTGSINRKYKTAVATRPAFRLFSNAPRNRGMMAERNTPRNRGLIAERNTRMTTVSIFRLLVK